MTEHLLLRVHRIVGLSNASGTVLLTCRAVHYISILDFTHTEEKHFSLPYDYNIFQTLEARVFMQKEKPSSGAEKMGPYDHNKNVLRILARMFFGMLEVYL